VVKQLKKNRKINTDSFLEAFRDLGGNVANSFKDDVIKGTGKGIVDTFDWGTNLANDKSKSTESNFSGQEVNRENRIKLQRQAETFRKEEHVLYNRQEQETKLQVQSLQHEIQQLVKVSNDLNKEVQIAAFNVPAESGKYHLIFFNRLRILIRSLRNQVQESAQWLAEFNSKSKKKNGYWGQFKKKGSSFSLSVDRNVSTQTG
jgi:hypothetical protein